MKHIPTFAAAAALFLSSGARTAAQIDFSVLQKSAIASVFHPVVGQGAVYQTMRSNAPGEAHSEEEISTVRKQTFEGRDGFWVEVSRSTSGGGASYAKIFITQDPFQFRRMVIQQAGQPAVEIPFHQTVKGQEELDANLKKWHVVGVETVSVPAGTYSCQHWSNDSGTDIWTSDKVTPFGAVKQVNSGETKVLVRLVGNAEEHITGPVKVFDPQALQQQMMQQMQNRKPPPN
jgi:hypothetical protein